MVEVPITIACGNYDRTRAIRDGRVKVEGCEATYLPLYPEETFFRAFRRCVGMSPTAYRRGHRMSLDQASRSR